MTEKIFTLIKQSAIYGVGRIGGKAMGFLLIPLYTRYLSTEEYGILSLIGMVSSVLGIMLGMGLNMAILKSYLQKPEEADRTSLVSTALILTLVVAVPGIIMALLSASPLSNLLLDNTMHAHLLVICFFTCFVGLVNAIPFSIMRAREQSTKFAFFSSMSVIASALFAILFVVVYQWGVFGILLGQLLSSLLLFGFLALPLMSACRPLTFSLAKTKNLLSFGLPLVPAALGAIIITGSDRYFLQHYSTLHELGLYSLGYRIGEIVLLVVIAVQMAWPAFLFGNQKYADAPLLYSRATTYYFLGMSSICLALGLFSRELVEIIAAPAFHEAYKVIPLIALSQFLYGLYFMTNAGINLAGMTRVLPFIVATAACSNVALNFALIPKYGMIGAALATALSYSIQLCLSFTLSQRYYHVPYEYGKIVKIASIGMFIYVVSLVVPTVDFFGTVTMKALLILLFPVILFLVGFFKEGELASASQLRLRF